MDLVSGSGSRVQVQRSGLFIVFILKVNYWL